MDITLLKTRTFDALRFAALALCMGIPFLTPSLFIEHVFYIPVLAFISGALLLKKERGLPGNFYTAAAALFLLCAFWFTPEKSLAAEHMAYALLYYLVYAMFKGEERRKTAFFIVAYSLIMAVYTAYQYLVVYPQLLKAELNDTQLSIIRGSRFFGTFALPNIYAFFSIAAAGSALYLYRKTKKKSYLIITALNICMLVLTRTFIGYLLGGAMLLWYLYRYSRKASYYAAAAGGALTVLFVSFRGVASLSHSLGFRVSNYISALRIFMDHPMAGVGINNFDIYYPEYMMEGANFIHNAHSMLMQTAADMGIFGLMISAGMIIYVWRRRRDMMFPLLAVLMIYFMTDLVFYIPSVAVLFWALSAGEDKIKAGKKQHNILCLILILSFFTASAGYIRGDESEIEAAMSRDLQKNLEEKRYYSHFIQMYKLKKVVKDEKFMETYEYYKKNWEK